MILLLALHRDDKNGWTGPPGWFLGKELSAIQARFMRR
jgi:hypothetical protein